MDYPNLTHELPNRYAPNGSVACTKAQFVKALATAHRFNVELASVDFAIEHRSFMAIGKFGPITIGIEVDGTSHS